jgi:uncharacterized membrane protein
MKHRVLQLVISGLSEIPVILKRKKRRVKLDAKRTLLPLVCVDVKLISIVLYFDEESCQPFSPAVSWSFPFNWFVV